MALGTGAPTGEYWARVTPTQFNDYGVHVNKIKGADVWHSHTDTDDVLMVLAGRMVVKMRDEDVDLGLGEMIVVPAGLEHCPSAAEETVIMCIEPRYTAPSGQAKRQRAPGSRL